MDIPNLLWCGISFCRLERYIPIIGKKGNALANKMKITSIIKTDGDGKTLYNS